MQIMDSPARYGAVSRFFHWSIAGLMIWQFLGMAIKVMLGRDAALTGMIAGSHQSLGFVLFVLIVLRVIWALANLHRRPPHEAGLAGLAAKAGHVVLYALMILVPAVALIRAWGSDRAYVVFGWPVFPARAEGDVVQWAVDLGGNWHGEAGWLLAVLIVGHAVMAIWHTAVRRDGTMTRMAGAAV
ncbi:MAG: cytochrome b [Paracoccus sp. (in: a-proteobacteria)]|nr:cytochrome b [Paracoccus sp. (in: a-proteobacteria)]